ncbi:DUF3794 domain-containing protein [Bacillus tianshenii]|nr:DUF3794 domain-containing protein [Bacillus tianshenii]
MSSHHHHKGKYGSEGKPSTPLYPQHHHQEKHHEPKQEKKKSVKRHKNAVVPSSTNKNVHPKAIKKAYVKVPVVLSETKVQIDMDATIKFPEPVLEIKEVKKNLKVTQCRLLLPTNKLFIKGFVRKNIQYATPKYSDRNSVVSNIRSLTIDLPFSTVTEIDYINPPQFEKNPDRRDFTYFRTHKLPQGFSDKDQLLSGDLSQFDQISGETFNELPYCELLHSNFIEYDEALDRKMGRVQDGSGNWVDGPFEEGTFTKVEEKMVVELTLKVLQKQQVYIDEKGHHHHCDYDKDDHYDKHKY